MKYNILIGKSFIDKSLYKAYRIADNRYRFFCRDNSIVNYAYLLVIKLYWWWNKC